MKKFLLSSQHSTEAVPHPYISYPHPLYCFLFHFMLIIFHPLYEIVHILLAQSSMERVHTQSGLLKCQYILYIQVRKQNVCMLLKCHWMVSRVFLSYLQSCCTSVLEKHSLKRQCIVWQKLSSKDFGEA